MVIELELDGIFSIFKYREPTNNDLIDNILVVITPFKIWNPHCNSYANNELSFLNYDLNVLPNEYVHKELVEEHNYSGLDCENTVVF